MAGTSPAMTDPLRRCPLKTKKYVARMSEAISGSKRETGPGCRFAHPGYRRVKPGDDSLFVATSKPKKRTRGPPFATSLGARAELSTPPGLEDYFLAFLAFLAFFAFFAFFAFLAIASSFGLMGGNATRGMLGGGPTSQHPRSQSQQICRPLPHTVTRASSRYPQLLCVLPRFRRRDAPHTGESSASVRANAPPATAGQG